MTSSDSVNISSIALFIANSLLVQSTIRVLQHKNKFNQVRVYCQLAAPDLVLKRWIEFDGLDGLPTVDYTIKCLDNDSFLYRDTYKRMIDLVPQYKEQIVECADYHYLLFDSREKLDAWIDLPQTRSMVERNNGFLVNSIDELRQRLYKIYERQN